MWINRKCYLHSKKNKFPFVPQERREDNVEAQLSAGREELYCAETTGEYTFTKMNTIVFNKLSSQVLFEEKAKEAEMSSRNYLEVIDGQHPDLLSSSQAMKDNAARHRRAGYVTDQSHTNHVCMKCSEFISMRTSKFGTLRLE